ncbi:MAG: hypothetical protein KBD94_03350 [Pyrinomonadaceae bacterium]|nr:hypothetical protein [Pyrinomonadaceae bacterium]
MYKHLVTLGLLVTISCYSPDQQTPETSTNAIPQITENPTEVESVANELVESFSDDSKIGKPRRNKIQLDIFKRLTSDSAYKPNNVAVVKLYSLASSNEWILKQTLEIEDHALADSDPKIEDFNNDGLKDITFVSNTAARGANVVRTLLIYDKTRDELVWIRNSEDYPNLAYNKTLNCIDAWLFHGTTTTVFLRLDGDRLREFASVGTGSDLVVTVAENNGEEREILRKKMREEDVYTRYRTYNPPRP